MHNERAGDALKQRQRIADFENVNIKLGGSAKLNGPLGAFALQLVGKDSRGFGDETPPALDSVEYAIELVEMYWASLLRDVPFTEYGTNATAIAAANELSALRAANPGKYAGPVDGTGKVTPDLLFRGGFGAQPAYFGGELDGPYLSQHGRAPHESGKAFHGATDRRLQGAPQWLDGTSSPSARAGAETSHKKTRAEREKEKRGG
jgi:hypothetical protein